MAEAQKDFKYIVRVANTDLNGNKKLIDALRKIKGVGFMFANAICEFSGVQSSKQTGILTKQDIEKLEKVLNNPLSAGLPAWMLNRRKDYETGEDLHLVGSDLRYQLDNDLKAMKKLKSYRGMRHAYKLPVRGQRTKSNFRKNRKVSVAAAKKK